MLNLARRPFVNARPVRRISAALWVVGTVLLAANVWLFASYHHEAAGREAELELGRDRIATAERRIGDLENQIERARLPQLAQQVSFLNLRIAERTFDWGQLFDRLAGVLPWDVRIISLSPVSLVPEAKKTVRGATPNEPRDRFQLKIEAAAQNDDALLRFLDALFKDASFADLSLEREARREQGVVFFVSVTYFPAGAPARPATETPPAVPTTPDKPAEPARREEPRS